MSIGILFLTLFLVSVFLYFWLHGIKYRKVFAPLAGKYNGSVNFFGVLEAPVEGNRICLSHLMHQAWGDQVNSHCLQFSCKSERLNPIEDFLIYKDFGLRRGTAILGMQEYKTDNSLFDQKYIIAHKKDQRRGLEKILNAEFQEKILNAGRDTQYLDIVKQGPRIWLEYEKYKIKNDAELEKIFHTLLDIYRSIIKY